MGNLVQYLGGLRSGSMLQHLDSSASELTGLFRAKERQWWREPEALCQRI